MFSGVHLHLLVDRGESTNFLCWNTCRCCAAPAAPGSACTDKTLAHARSQCCAGAVSSPPPPICTDLRQVAPRRGGSGALDDCSSRHWTMSRVSVRQSFVGAHNLQKSRVSKRPNVLLPITLLRTPSVRKPHCKTPRRHDGRTKSFFIGGNG